LLFNDLRDEANKKSIQLFYNVTDVITITFLIVTATIAPFHF